MNTDLTVLTFESPTGADTMLETLKDLQDYDFIELLDAVIVTKDAKGNVRVRQPLEVGPGKGAAFGALTGAIVGLLGGPGGALVGLVSGAVTGGATGAALEAGLPQDDIKAVAVDQLAPNGSALMVYIDQVWMDNLEDAAREMKANIVRHEVDEQRKTARQKAVERRKEEIDRVYQTWQTKVNDLRSSVTTLREQIANDARADREAIQHELDNADAALHTFYKNMVQTLNTWQKQIDADIAELENKAKTANANAKADIERRIAADKAARAAIRTRVEDTLTARLNTVKADIEALKAQAARAQGEAKAKLDQQIATLQADWNEEQKRLDALDKADEAAWAQLVKSIDDAFDTFDTSIDEAETEYAKRS